MVLEVLHYPNPILKKKSQIVQDFGKEFHQFLDDMYETMLVKNGVGLAAIQVGVELRALLVNIPREDGKQYQDDLLEIVNPQILQREGEILFQEGCLSVPNFYEDVRRFDQIKLSYQNRFGEEKILDAQGYLAVAIQHEIDHLDGILFVDRLSLMKRKKFEKEFKRIQRKKK